MALASVFASTIGIQILGFLRHTLVAAYFGISRDLDLYFLVNAIAMITVFVFGSVFDTIAVPQLTKLFDNKDSENFWNLANRIFTYTILFSCLVSLIFIVSSPLLIPIFGAGLNAVERARMSELTWYFLPWTLICLPYYSICSIYKAQWRFKRVFSAEIAIAGSSLLALLFLHADVSAIPIAYGIGYIVGALWLMLGSQLRLQWPKWSQMDLRLFQRNLLELVGANQLGSLLGLIERFIQSYLQQGVISAYGYVSLIVNSAGGLLNFREIFIVPLSQPQERSERLERIQIGLSLLAIPTMVFLSSEARLIIRVLFERGHFNAQAVDLSAELLNLYAWALWPAMVNAPMQRMFQVLDKIYLNAHMYAASAFATLFFGVILVLLLDLKYLGFISTLLIASYVSCLTTVIKLRGLGLSTNWWRIGKYCAYSIVFSALAAGAVKLIPHYANQYLDVVFHGVCYTAVVAVGYALILKKIKAVIRYVQS